LDQAYPDLGISSNPGRVIGQIGVFVHNPATYFSRRKVNDMAEEITQPATTAEGQQQNIQVFVDEREMKTTYANLPRIHQTAEEVFVDFGVQVAQPNQQGQPQIMLKVQDRVIMSYPTAKRLVNALGQLIKRYEQQFGEIPMQPGQRR
jgi:hypothetical protein